MVKTYAPTLTGWCTSWLRNQVVTRTPETVTALLFMTYSECPKTGRPVFEFLGSRPFVRTSGFRVITRNPDVFVRLSDCPVASIDRFIYKTFFLLYIKRPMLVNRTIIMPNRTSENRTYFRPDSQTGRPVFGYLLYIWHIINDTTIWRKLWSLF